VDPPARVVPPFCLLSCGQVRFFASM
jgi:hypothetical protein